MWRDTGRRVGFFGLDAWCVAPALWALGASGQGITVAVIAVGEMATVLVLRAHYTLDVIAGAAVAFFAYHIAGNVSPAIDAWLR